MKYAIELDTPFKNPFRYNNRIDEIILPCGNASTDARSVLKVPSKDFKKDFKIPSNVDAVRIDAPATNEEARTFFNQIRAQGLPAFFHQYVTSWDTLSFLLSLGVSDIYICEELGFSLSEVRPVAKDINIRVIPNIAQSSCNETSSILKFFVRPEDIEYLEPFADICEFVINKEDTNRATSAYEALYRVYAINKSWSDDLSKIIAGAPSIKNNMLPPNFAGTRFSCSKKCFKGRKCHKCQTAEKVATNLEKTYTAKFS